ncbi:hypothetical protein A7X61_03950 [Stenotrophomonas maltophilia]|nr:hypothetical protein A7X61_03950 [Stenotrophomonas maltophilia]
MELISTLHDGRIDAKNVLVLVSISEYLAIAKEIIKNNEFQRRRVKSSPTIYSLLKEDIQRGCVIPPIVLALSGDGADEIQAGGEVEYILQHSRDLLILDGLQRTSSMIELEAELSALGDREVVRKLGEQKLRLEIYIGLNRLGVLYRMLTLNTGQTPMSLRQQVEILFLDYSRVPMGGITLVRESDDEAVDQVGKYSFKAIIDGFSSYLERNELPIDRYDLLESVKSLQKLSKEDSNQNLFKEFTETYHALVVKLNQATNGKVYNSQELDIRGQPFGLDARRIFSKEQAMAGFGAGVGKLRDFNKVGSFDDLRESIDKLIIGEDDLDVLLKTLESIRLSSKKIGNSQRLYFHFFFRELFNPEGDAYRNLGGAVDVAYKKYQSQTL